MRREGAGRGWIVAGVVAIVAGIASAAVAAGPGRVGDRVVARFGDLALRDDHNAIAGIGDRRLVYRVERIDGPKVWLRAEGKDLAGWAPASEVVSADSAPVWPGAAGQARPTRPGIGPTIVSPIRRAESKKKVRNAEAASGHGELDRAIAECGAAIRIDPRNAEAYYLRGITFQAMGRMDQALIDLDQAIQLAPRDAAMIAARGEIRLALKDHSAALNDLDTAIRLGYRDANVYLNRASVRIARGEADAAMADLDEAIARDPRSAAAYGLRAEVWTARRRYDRTLADLEEAIRLDPLGRAWHRELARLLATGPDARLRNGRRAVEEASRACDLGGWRGADDLEVLAAVHAEAGDLAAAAKWQTDSISRTADPAIKARREQKLQEYRAGRR